MSPFFRSLTFINRDAAKGGGEWWCVATPQLPRPTKPSKVSDIPADIRATNFGQALQILEKLGNL